LIPDLYLIIHFGEGIVTMEIKILISKPIYSNYQNSQNKKEIFICFADFSIAHL